jgi:ABC-type dipeptide/oligopeptide/nickel transport system permease subunit
MAGSIREFATREGLNMSAGAEAIIKEGFPRVSVQSRRAANAQRSISRTLRRHPPGVLAAAFLIIIALAGCLAEIVATHDPNAQAVRDALRPPLNYGLSGSFHILGTDAQGRDVYSRIVHGARISLSVGFAAVTIGTLGGLALALVSGYRGGRVDLVLQRIMDSLQAIPTLILAMMLVAVMGTNLLVTAIAIGITQVPRANRVIRSNVLTVMSEPYVESARAVGAPGLRVIVRHLLPNVMATTLIMFSTSIGAAIVTEATLSFLGLAAPPPLATWGGMLTIQGRQYMLAAPWLLLAPAIALSMTVLAFNFLGDAIRDALDPRLRTR